MKLYERKMVYRVYKALDSVSGAHIGGSTQSVTVKGVASFAHDMTKLRELLLPAISVLMDGSIHDPDRQARFDAAMLPVESFTKQTDATSKGGAA